MLSYPDCLLFAITGSSINGECRSANASKLFFVWAF
jgi:hypothetical protein